MEENSKTEALTGEDKDYNCVQKHHQPVRGELGEKRVYVHDLGETNEIIMISSI